MMWVGVRGKMATHHSSCHYCLSVHFCYKATFTRLPSHCHTATKYSIDPSESLSCAHTCTQTHKATHKLPGILQIAYVTFRPELPTYEHKNTLLSLVCKEAVSPDVNFLGLRRGEISDLRETESEGKAKQDWSQSKKQIDGER